MALDAAQIGSGEELSDEVGAEGLVRLGDVKILIQKCEIFQQLLGCMFDCVISHACKKTCK